jgi:glycosyltransferase involved in cell wall biosynthesis
MFAALMPHFLKRHSPVIVYSKGAICILAVSLLEKLTGRRAIKIFEIHNVVGSRVEKRIFGIVDLIVVNSKAVFSEIKEAGVNDDKLLIAYNAPFVDMQPMNRRTARSRLKLSERARILMYSGKLYESNIRFFISLAHKLKSIGYELHLVGGNPRILDFAEKLKSESGLDNIVFHGFQPPVKMGLFIQAADFLFCSYEEDYPLIYQATPGKCFDYLASGRPFLCSDNTAIGEILIDGENCKFFAPHSSDEIVEIIRELEQRPEQISRMIDNNRKLAEKLSWSNRIKSIAARIEAVIPSST